MSGTTYACGLVAGLAIAYAVEEWRRLRSGRLFRFVGRSQAVRRIIGSLLVAVLMVLVHAGLELIDPHASTRLFIVVWSVSALLVLLLFALALLDLRELRANEDIARARELIRLGQETGQAARSAAREPATREEEKR